MKKRIGIGWRGLSIALALSLSALTEAIRPQPAQSAEKIHITLSALDFSVSIASLEVFAKEGKITPEFAVYAKRLDREKLAVLRSGLQKRLDYSSVQVARLTYTDLGESLLKRLGLLMQPTPGVSGFTALRAALILAAADPVEGLTPLNMLRRFPTSDIWVSGETLVGLAKQVTVLPKYRDAIVTAVTEQAAIEAGTDPAVNWNQLPDLRQPGPYRVTQQTLTFPIAARRQTPQGLADSYRLPVDIYRPQGLSQPAPLVVMAHGFGSTRETYGYVAQHLASHGIVVAAPEHIGSDLDYRNRVLRGLVKPDISPLEFVSRPLDITATIDAIEQLVATDPAWAGQVNLQQIGVFGNSFGGTTALSIAGATLNPSRLQKECQPDQHVLNISVLLQCRARSLPTQPSQRDRRVKAVFAAYPMTSVVFGPEGLGPIAIPTLILAGSRDVFTPVITEQLHAYTWLKTPIKHLALMINGTHFSSATDEINAKLPGILKSPRPDLGRQYVYALSVAFFYRYLANRSDYQPYLNASYGQAIGQEPLDLQLVRSLTPEQIQKAYGKRTPWSILPE